MARLEGNVLFHAPRIRIINAGWKCGWPIEYININILSVYVYILINSYESIIPKRGVVSRHAHYASVDNFILIICNIFTA